MHSGEGYFAKLRNEYLYLAHKYSLHPLDGRQWKPMGKGSNRNPHSAFSFLANMCYQRKTSLQSMLACDTVKEVTKLLEVSATGFSCMSLVSPYPYLGGKKIIIILKSQCKSSEIRAFLVNFASIFKCI
jgi:hypothetical protein